MASNMKDVLALTAGSATVTYRGRTVRYVNEGGDTYDNTSRFYVCTTDAYGSPEAIVHVQVYGMGDSIQDAWEAFIDSCPTIDPSEVWEAYGCDSPTDLIDGDAELIEGYEYQDNASGTGIVDVGHNANMVPANFVEIEFSCLTEE